MLVSRCCNETLSIQEGSDSYYVCNFCQLSCNAVDVSYKEENV